MKTFNRSEVLKHNTSDDCWVIINNNVCNVTNFIHNHPGGVAALSKQGRAGNDVTSHFKRIGHSKNAYKIMRSLSIGIIIQDDEFDEITIDPPEIEFDQKERATQFHAKRRQEILQKYPTIQSLIGHNPYTPLLGLITVLIHASTCVYAQQQHWIVVVILSYTIGAICKMWQFAINHDICHGTAGSLLAHSPFLSHTAMHLLTLPSFGGATHMYYSFQHIGHHASLGHQSLEQLQISEVDDGIPLLVTTDGDGDAFAIGTLSLGRILQSWSKTIINTSASVDEGVHLDNIYLSPMKKLPSWLKNNFYLIKLFKIIAAQGLHVAHHLSLLQPYLYAAIVMPPPLAILIMLLPKYIYPVQGQKWFQQIRAMASISIHSWLWIGLNVIMSMMVGNHASTTDVGCHWNLANSNITGRNKFQLCGDLGWTPIMKGLLYLYLSELFLYGFCLHPFMGYFLGTHRSGGLGFNTKSNSSSIERGGYEAVRSIDSTKEEKDDTNMNDLHSTPSSCQPTMSTYSLLSSISSLWLSHHVEHHDFPNVPWNNLKKITAIAPEYYNHLESSNGFTTTIYQWILHGHDWGYACQ